MKHIMITAHSGCEGTPDNSLASIEKGIALSADCVEIDIRADRFGKLWLTHDLPEDFSGLVSLEEAFALIGKSGIAVNCDLKEYGALIPTLELAEKYGIGADRLFLNSEELVRDLTKGERPDRLGQSAFLLANASLAAERLHTLGAAALNTPYKYTPDELIAKMRARNVALPLWTLNEEAALREFMQKDLLNITTRTVSLALAVRNA